MNNIKQWIRDLKRRGCHITVTDRVVHVRGAAANDHDHRQVTRHHHALETAAAGTHTGWWDVVTGRTDSHPDVELPGTYPDPACARCGHPAPYLDADLLPWCEEHR